MKQLSLFFKNPVKKIIVIGLFLLLLGISGCSKYRIDKGNMTIKDIVYEKESDNSNEYTVFIGENGSLEPYIAIDDNNSGVLLLRKYLLDIPIPYNTETSFGSKSGYYSESIVDNYLNKEYLLTLCHYTQGIIKDSSIKISTLKTVDSGGSIRKTESIERKAFVLSATELGIKSNMTSKENESLNYFKDNDNLIATYKDGVADAYWLRSAYLWDDHQAWAVGSDGRVGGSLVSFEYTLRPAFYLPRDTPIEKEYLDGNDVYVIKR